jgi:hypothetical protein
VSFSGEKTRKVGMGGGKGRVEVEMEVKGMGWDGNTHGVGADDAA